MPAARPIACAAPPLAGSAALAGVGPGCFAPRRLAGLCWPRPARSGAARPRLGRFLHALLRPVSPPGPVPIGRAAPAHLRPIPPRLRSISGFLPRQRPNLWPNHLRQRGPRPAMSAYLRPVCAAPLGPWSWRSVQHRHFPGVCAGPGPLPPRPGGPFPHQIAGHPAAPPFPANRPNCCAQCQDRFANWQSRPAAALRAFAPGPRHRLLVGANRRSAPLAPRGARLPGGPPRRRHPILRGRWPRRHSTPLAATTARFSRPLAWPHWPGHHRARPANWPLAPRNW